MLLFLELIVQTLIGTNEGNLILTFHPVRFYDLLERKHWLRENTEGWCYAESLMCRPKVNNIAVMYFVQGKYFWFHMRNGEFYEIFCKSR